MRRGTRPWHSWLTARTILDMAYHNREMKEDVPILPTRGNRRIDAILMTPDYVQAKLHQEYNKEYLIQGGDHALVWVSWGSRKVYSVFSTVFLLLLLLVVAVGCPAACFG